MNRRKSYLTRPTWMHLEPDWSAQLRKAPPAWSSLDDVIRRFCFRQSSTVASISS